MEGCIDEWKEGKMDKWMDGYIEIESRKKRCRKTDDGRKDGGKESG